MADNFLAEAWSGIVDAPVGVKIAMGGALGVAAFLGYRQYRNNQSSSVSNGQGLPLTQGDANTQTVAGAPGFVQGGNGGSVLPPYAPIPAPGPSPISFTWNSPLTYGGPAPAIISGVRAPNGGINQSSGIGPNGKLLMGAGRGPIRQTMLPVGPR